MADTARNSTSQFCCYNKLRAMHKKSRFQIKHNNLIELKPKMYINHPVDVFRNESWQLSCNLF